MARYPFAQYDINVAERNSPSDAVFQYALYPVRQERNGGGNTQRGSKPWTRASILRFRICRTEPRLVYRNDFMDNNGRPRRTFLRLDRTACQEI